MIGIPKKPADRDAKLRELARGEACTLQFPGGYCDPQTTVWAHPNGLAENKGLGYKGSDSRGVFACHRCHKVIDQPGPSDPGPIARAHFWQGGLERTRIRLREIAASPTMRPWKVEAARRTLAKLGDHTVPGIEDVPKPGPRVSRPRAAARKG